MRRVLVLNVAALSAAQIGPSTPNLQRLAARGGLTPMVPPFGALTCPSHASMSTGLPPAAHGIVGNGWYERTQASVLNWVRSNRLITGEQVFEAVKARAPDALTASLFWRYTAHSAADLKVIERPTYWASGKKSFDFYTDPDALHGRALDALGPFPFPHFWGPLAGYRSTGWILDLTRKVLAEDRPALTLAYAPYLDYDGQRYGPDDPRALDALATLDAGLAPLLEAADAEGVDVAIVSDYGFVAVSRPVFLNRALREAGYLSVHAAANGEVLEPGTSRAFAHCDNQLAHVYVHDPADRAAVSALLAATEGVARVLDPMGQADEGIAHARSGDLVCVAERDAWFAYPYWIDDRRAPDFARCIAIFDKPGFDPCELFAPPGLGGELHLVKRVLQKKLGLAVPFDVVDPDASRVGGARNADRRDLLNGAVLLTSWARPEATSVPSEAVKQVVLDRMFA